jgi:hypothetical protein
METTTTNNAIQFEMDWGGKHRACRVEPQSNNEYKVYFDGIYLALMNIDPNSGYSSVKWGIPFDRSVVDEISQKVRYPYELKNAG